MKGGAAFCGTEFDKRTSFMVHNLTGMHTLEMQFSRVMLYLEETVRFAGHDLGIVQTLSV